MEEKSYCVTCIDPEQEVYQQKMTKVRDSIIAKLKGLTYSEAKQILDSLSWEISTKAIIK